MDGKLPLKANLELEGRGSLRVATIVKLTDRFRPIPTLWSPKIVL